MRVTNNMMSMTMYSSMVKSNAAYYETASKMATGNRLLRPSDDPLAARSIQDLQHQEAMVNTYMNSLDTMEATFMAADSYLTQMNSVCDRITEIAVLIGSGTASPEEREAYAAELEQLNEALALQVNGTSPTGYYMFGGNVTDQPPLVEVTDSVTGETTWEYQGDTGSRPVPVAEGITIDTALSPFADLFGSGDDIFNVLDDTVEVLRDPNATPEEVSQASQDLLDATEEFQNALNQSLAELGGKMNMVDDMQLSHTDNLMFNQQLQGQLGDLDYAQASIDLSESMVALQAVQKTYIDISQMNLFQMM
ncbi:flagellar hook-associated protein FlgL [Aeromonas aquatica]|uniref:flagellar hook-associated protein FlgL n=1 Tax=Aeromonas aquatica TaxID=558964 RepID=UPI00286EF702|nr:flagellar hook-associated protein FlgL [Aeromonas aquatica]